MFGPEFINMGEYDDYYNARLESYREGFISLSNKQRDDDKFSKKKLL